MTDVELIRFFVDYKEGITFTGRVAPETLLLYSEILKKFGEDLYKQSEIEENSAKNSDGSARINTDEPTSARAKGLLAGFHVIKGDIK